MKKQTILYFENQINMSFAALCVCLCFAPLGDNVPKVLVFTTDGDFLLSWNTTSLEMPHGIFLADAASSNPTVWITDVGNGPYGHCIKQYSPSGKLLQVTALSRI